jgi:hypothetical protein
MNLKNDDTNMSRSDQGYKSDRYLKSPHAHFGTASGETRGRALGHRRYAKFYPLFPFRRLHNAMEYAIVVTFGTKAG